jgi:hypothetical protein
MPYGLGSGLYCNKSAVADFSKFSFSDLSSLPMSNAFTFHRLKVFPLPSPPHAGERDGVRGVPSPLKRSIPTIFLILLFPLFFGGCGIKAAPVAPDSAIPAPASDLQAWLRDGKVFLQWKIPTRNIDGSRLMDLLGFKVFRQSRPLESAPCEPCSLAFEPVAEIDKDFPKTARVEKGMVFWQDAAVRPQNEYTYFVQVYNRYRSPSPESNRVKIFWDDPPAAPGRVNLRKEDRALEIAWEPVSLLVDGREMVDFQGFNIYRRSEGEIFSLSPLNAEPIPDRRYWDGQVELGKQYSYEVRTVRNFHGTLIEGPSSGVVQGVPEKRIPPSVPTGLVAVWQKEGVALRWDMNPEPDIAGYNLYRREKEGKEFVLVNPRLIREPYFLDGSADLQRSYIYRLQAVDSSPSRNESDFSKEVEVPPEAPLKN